MVESKAQTQAMPEDKKHFGVITLACEVSDMGDLEAFAMEKRLKADRKEAKKRGQRFSKKDWSPTEKQINAAFSWVMRDLAADVARYTNVVRQVMFVKQNPVLSGRLEGQTTYATIKQCAGELVERLSTQVREASARGETERLSGHWGRIKAGCESLPNSEPDLGKIIPVRDTGIVLWRDESGAYCKLSILPQKNGRRPRQPTFRLLTGKIEKDNLRRGEKYELGQLLSLKDQSEILDSLLEGGSKCLAAKVSVNGSKLKLHLTYSRPAPVPEQSAQAVGMIWIDSMGRPVVIPRADEQRRFLAPTFHPPVPYWEHLLGYEIEQQRQMHRLRKILDRGAGSRRPMRRLSRKRKSRKKHLVVSLANDVVSHCRRHNLQPYIIYDNGGSKKKKYKWSVVPPYGLADRIRQVAEQQGMGVECVTLDKAKCPACEKEITLKEGIPLCQCNS